MFKPKRNTFESGLEILRTIAEPSINIPEKHQPSVFQTLGVHEVNFKSPTLLYSTGIKQEIQQSITVEDDDVVCIDPRVATGKINSFLIYSKYKKATVVDTFDGSVFQQLPSKHVNSLSCLRHFNHSLGHFLAQLSSDRFTLYTLGWILLRLCKFQQK